MRFRGALAAVVIGGGLGESVLELEVSEAMLVGDGGGWLVVVLAIDEKRGSRWRGHTQ
jgi:hypothetical protein